MDGALTIRLNNKGWSNKTLDNTKFFDALDELEIDIPAENSTDESSQPSNNREQKNSF